MLLTCKSGWSGFTVGDCVSSLHSEALRMR